ncbi:hypothetical protein PSAB6_490040 [Paraburkholderia sabiae]|nr:hypothetical protein PSAB6_490040 [Paraburkholderia sabiae]
MMTRLRSCCPSGRSQHDAADDPTKDHCRRGSVWSVADTGRAARRSASVPFAKRVPRRRSSKRYARRRPRRCRASLSFSRNLGGRSDAQRCRPKFRAFVKSAHGPGIRRASRRDKGESKQTVVKAGTTVA